MNTLRIRTLVVPLAAIAVTFALGMRLGEAPAIAAQDAASSAPSASIIDLTRHQGVIVEGGVGERGRLSVTCPSGTVIGGGFSHVSKDIHVIESRPDGIYSWQVSWIQLATDDSVLYVYASCLVV